MKKLLIFMLVLGMASLANATLQISVNGDMNPVDSEIWLLPSETIMLDIWTTNDITPGVNEGTFMEPGAFALVATTLDGQITGGVNTSGEASLLIYAYDTYTGKTGIWASLTLANVSLISANTVLVDQILFHCEQPGDVLIELLYDPAYPIYGVSPVLDSVIIHQIPEPMTVLLLGLGGLFLRRRK